MYISFIRLMVCLIRSLIVTFLGITFRTFQTYCTTNNVWILYYNIIICIQVLIENKLNLYLQVVQRVRLVLGGRELPEKYKIYWQTSDRRIIIANVILPLPHSAFSYQSFCQSVPLESMLLTIAYFQPLRQKNENRSKILELGISMKTKNVSMASCV